jgi:DNA-binding MarR family transcriptional regulator
MAVTRKVVLEQLAMTTDAERRETTTNSALAEELGTDEQTIVTHIDGLAACDLVRRYPDGRIRITITGEELLDLDIAERVIVDSS